MLKQGGKKIVCMVLALTLIITMAVPAVGFAESEGTVISVSKEEELIKAVEDASSGDTIQLETDIQLTDILEISGKEDLTIKGKTGKEKLTISLSSYSSAQKSEEDAMISVTDSALAIADLIMDGESHMRVLYIGAKGNVNLNSGAVVTGGCLGKSGQNYGAGILLTGRNATNAASLTLNNGAEVKENDANGGYSITGIGICNYRYGTITVNGGTVSGNEDNAEANRRKFSYGGGIALVGAKANLILKSGTISGNSAQGGGGGIYTTASAGTDIRIEGGTVSNNTTYTSGAGIYVGAAEVTMSGGAVSGNTAESDEAATVYASGGGVYVAGGSDSQGTFTLTGGTIEDNEAKSTAKSNANDPQIGQGGGVMADGTFLMTGGVISGNSAVTTNSLEGTAACGGGVSVKGGSNPGTFTMAGGTITDNTADNQGGAVYVNNKYLEQSTMYPTESAVLHSGNGNFEISGNIKITENLVSGSENNIYLPTGTVITIRDELSPQSEVYLGSEDTEMGTVIGEAGINYTITAADARLLKSNEGKNIYDRNSAGQIVISQAQQDSYIDLQDAEISGVEEEYSYTGHEIEPNPVVTLKGTVLKEGTDYTVSYNIKGYDNVNVSNSETKAVLRVTGAGAYTGTITKTFDIVPKNIEEIRIEPISDRIATGEAVTPAVKAYNEDVLMTEGTDFEVVYRNNTAVGTASATITGINNYTGTKEISFKIISSDGLTTADSEESLQTAIQDAEGSEGSPEAIYLLKDISLSETLEIAEGKSIRLVGNGDDTTISTETSLDNLIVAEGKMTIENMILNSNTKGRGLFVGKTGIATISNNTVITGGVCTRGSSDEEYSGGAIYNSGTVLIEAGELCGNKAKNGGAVYNSPDATITIQSASIHENEAVSAGGGLYNEGNAELKKDGVLSNNIASYSQGVFSAAGGGIYNSGEMACEEGSVIKENQAEKFGGGIYTTGKLSLLGGSIQGNTTEGDSVERVINCGGGVFVASGTFTMTEGTITDNTAYSTAATNTPYGSVGNGGGVYVNNSSDTASFVMESGTIRGNRAVSSMESEYFGHGGGVYVMGGENTSGNDNVKPGNFTMKGGTITENSSTGEGAGVYLGNKEHYTISYTNYDYIGSVNCSMSGNANVLENATDNVYLTSGVAIKLLGALNGQTIGVSSGGKGTVAVAEGSGYTVTESDQNKFKSDEALRTIGLDNENNQIVLQAIDLAERYSVQLSSETYSYTGREIKPEVEVTAKDGTTLKEGKDYEVAYDGSGTSNKKLINVGTKTVTVTGIGNYTGTLTKEYEIAARNIAEVSASIRDQYYTGVVLTPNPSSITYNSITLLRGTDYKISYSNNRNQGTAKVVLTGVGNFSGTKTITFKIFKRISNTTISAIANKAYTGRAIRPALTVRHGSSRLRSGTDYTVRYKNNVSTGKATVTITGKGYYKGTKSRAFKIVPRKATVSKVRSVKKGQLVVKWKRDKKANGYQVIVAKNKKFTKGKKTANITKNKTTSKTFKKLTKGKKYYVKVRAYKKIDGKKAYGAYSKVKNKKVKK